MLERTYARLRATYPIILIALVVVSYLPVFGAGFVWDDDENILDSPNLHDLRGLLRIWSDPHATQQYYPLTHSSFWLQAQTTGLSPLAFHAVNVALHALTAVLVLFVLRRLAVAGAEFGATLFALHPLNVESVAWITERKNVLSGVFALAACLCYLRYDDLAFAKSAARVVAARDSAATLGRTTSLPISARREGPFWAAALVLFLLALSAKTAVAVLPAALLVGLVGIRGRRVGALASALWPFFVAGAAAGLGTAFLERTHVHAQGAEFAWSFSERLLIAGRAFWFYPQKLLLPAHLMFFYPKWPVAAHASWSYCFPLAVLAGFVALVALRKQLGNGPLVVFLAYAALIFPALGFFNVYFMRFAFVQNHFQYLAGIPLLAGVAAAATRALSGTKFELQLALAAGVSALCGAQSFAESTLFHSYETLFRSALERNPDAWVAAYNLGLRYQQAGDSAQAIEMYRAARRVRPDDPDVIMNLGTALAEASHFPEALAALADAVRLRPRHPESRRNLALTLDLAGDPAASALAYGEAIRLRPNYTRAKREAAWLLATTSDPRVRNGPAALTLATSACAETVRAVARCQDTLAAAEAAAGDFESASARALRAAELARREGHEAAARSYEARARLYATRSSYVDRHHGFESGERAPHSSQ